MIWTIRFQFLAGIHPASYSMDTWGGPLYRS